MAEMTGAQALLATLVDAGVDVCFTNPGTSEMHFVQALDSVPGMRGVLAVFEGVATGAADGYARIAGKPAAVLLHLGPGLGNGLANLHNARRANTPVVCLVGAHATDHVRYDAPLQSDIEAAARTVSGWVHTSGTVRGLAGDVARAITASGRDGGQVATLVVPADLSWQTGGRPAAPEPAVTRPPAAARTLDEVAALLGSGDPPVLFLGGRALSERGLKAASRISAATGARLLAETFPARIEGGAGLPRVQRLAYFPDQADKQMAGIRQLILIGARSPVAFFGYPGRGGDLVPEECVVTALADRSQDTEAALEELAARVAAGTEPVVSEAGQEGPRAGQPEPADEPLTAFNLAGVLAASLPDQAIVVDEGNTSSLGLPTALAGAARHSLLCLTGGAIGMGLPVATGAAVAAPDRPVSRWRPTAARCTPSRRCGPRPGSSSTSPPS